MCGSKRPLNEAILDAASRTETSRTFVPTTAGVVAPGMEAMATVPERYVGGTDIACESMYAISNHSLLDELYCTLPSRRPLVRGRTERLSSRADVTLFQVPLARLLPSLGLRTEYLLGVARSLSAILGTLFGLRHRQRSDKTFSPECLYHHTLCRQAGTIDHACSYYPDMSGYVGVPLLFCPALYFPARLSSRQHHRRHFDRSVATKPYRASSYGNTSNKDINLN